MKPRLIRSLDQIHFLLLFSLAIIIFLANSCNDIYKAGNSSPLLGIQIECNLNQDVAFQYFDTSRQMESFKLPAKYNDLLKGGDLEYLAASNKVFYFKDAPEEAYHLGSSGILFLQQVYNPSLGSNNWIYESSKLHDTDLVRIENRIKIVLNKIMLLEKAGNMQDSMIFLYKPYDSLVCKLKLL